MKPGGPAPPEKPTVVGPEAFVPAGDVLDDATIEALTPRCSCCGTRLPTHTAIAYCDVCNVDACLDDDGNARHG